MMNNTFGLCLRGKAFLTIELYRKTLQNFLKLMFDFFIIYFLRA